MKLVVPGKRENGIIGQINAIKLMWRNGQTKNKVEKSLRRHLFLLSSKRLVFSKVVLTILFFVGFCLFFCLLLAFTILSQLLSPIEPLLECTSSSSDYLLLLLLLWISNASLVSLFHFFFSGFIKTNDKHYTFPIIK